MPTRTIFDKVVIKNGNEFLEKLNKSRRSNIDNVNKNIKVKDVINKKEIERILKGCQMDKINESKYVKYSAAKLLYKLSK